MRRDFTVSHTVLRASRPVLLCAAVHGPVASGPSQSRWAHRELSQVRRFGRGVPVFHTSTGVHAHDAAAGMPGCVCSWWCGSGGVSWFRAVRGPVERSDSALRCVLCRTMSAPRRFTVVARSQKYAGFNLLVADTARRACGHLSNRGAGVPTSVTPGLHAVSNGALNGDWPKLRRGKDALQRMIASGTLHGDSVPWDDVSVGARWKGRGLGPVQDWDGRIRLSMLR